MVDRLVLHSNHYYPHAHAPHHHHHNVTPLLGSHNRKKKVKRLSATSQLLQTSQLAAAASTPTPAAVYYPSAYITKPCDQLFGPCSQLLFGDDDSVTVGNNNHNEPSNLEEVTASKRVDYVVDENCKPPPSDESATAAPAAANLSSQNVSGGGGGDRFEYIPAPKWTKIQNSILEELFKKSRYPKSSELKSLAQRFHVMDSDIEEWFRKRRGRDRKIRRKNEVLKNLIDNYIDK